MDYYNFCQKYEEYFKITQAIDSNRVFFTISFLRRKIPQQYLQHKRWLLIFSPDLPIWKYFKGFLHKNLRDSQVFVDNILNKLKQAVWYQLTKL